MNVVICGKVHRQGTSRAGRDYDFNEIHFLAPQRGIEGLAAVTKIVGKDVIAYDKILVQQSYDLEIDLQGNIISMRPSRA